MYFKIDVIPESTIRLMIYSVQVHIACLSSDLWYIFLHTGKVLDVTLGEDGDSDAEYEVEYDGCEELNLVERLLDDYYSGILIFL